MNIFQIYHSKSLIPEYVSEHIKKLNPEYNYKFLDFKEGKEIIKQNFNIPSIKNKIINAIDNMPRYCHKSDLLRYCLLYIYGGVYIDVDLQPLVSFKEMIPENVSFFSSIGGGPNPYLINGNKILCCCANGILYSKKNNTLLLELIKFSIGNSKLFSKNPIFRGENVYYLFNYLREECKKNNILFEPFKIMNIHKNNVYLLNTHPNDIPKFGINCIINKNQVVIWSNNPMYNFVRQSSSCI